jgi:ABC-2 type transport system ATP-binding protein
MWDLIAELVAGGTTLLLTTQYLEEADRLASDIVVIDHGHAIARGSAEELKAMVGGERLIVTVAAGSDLATAARQLSALATSDAEIDPEARQVAVSLAAAPGLMTSVVAQLSEVGVRLDDAHLTRPTLDDVFLRLTGHAAEDGATSMEAAA